MEKNSSTKLAYTEDKRPKRTTTSGSGNYCCMRTCKSTQYKVCSNIKTKSGIGFFRFPKSPGRRKQWIHSISRWRRKGGDDKFNVDNALLCEFHFDSKDINVSIGMGKKTLKRKTVPTFPDMQSSPISKRKSPTKRILFEEVGEPSTSSTFDYPDIDIDTEPVCHKCNEYQEQIQSLIDEKNELLQK